MSELDAGAATVPPDVLMTYDEAAAGGGDWFTLLLLPVFLGIIYFVAIRPQQQEQKKHEELIAGLAKGDQVVTKSGLHGKVDKVADDTLVVVLGDKVKVTIDKVAVARKLGEPTAGAKG